MAHIETQQLPIQNRHSISTTFYAPNGDTKGAILIVPAMGVTQKYYAAFATWLATQGYLVATFDYAGTGLSKAGELRDFDVDISDWAKFDCAAVLQATANKADGKPLFWLGHSLGGQILGMIPNHIEIAKAITIASGSGYWLENVPSLKWRAWWLWYFVVPVATRLFGYFPGKRLRKVGNLPAGVMNQWRSWCLNPEYMVGVEGDELRAKFEAVKLPITSFSFSDDELMSARNIESLHSFYTSSPKTMNRISPEDIGAKRIGHFGFFKPRFKKSLWEGYLLPELS